jgi:hypothetical protein
MEYGIQMLKVKKRQHMRRVRRDISQIVSVTASMGIQLISMCYICIYYTLQFVHVHTYLIQLQYQLHVSSFKSSRKQ